MKKGILTVICLSIATITFSQAKLELGLKGGVNLASLKGNGVDGDNLTAFHGGAYGLIKITKIGIQPEAIFSKRGADGVDLAYMDVPIMLKYYIAGGLNLQAGPQFGILLNEDLRNAQSGTFSPKNSDISAVVGAGFDLPMGLNITGRYILGLSDANDVAAGPSVKGHTWQFSIGYALVKLGK